MLFNGVSELSMPKVYLTRTSRHCLVFMASRRMQEVFHLQNKEVGVRDSVCVGVRGLIYNWETVVLIWLASSLGADTRPRQTDKVAEMQFGPVFMSNHCHQNNGSYYMKILCKWAIMWLNDNPLRPYNRIPLWSEILLIFLKHSSLSILGKSYMRKSL